MTIQYYPNQDVVRKAMAKDEPIMMLVGFDAKSAIVAPLDVAVEHNVLLDMCGLNSLDIDKYFRIIFDSDGADWTFICPPKYKNIQDKSRRVTQFYNDGFNIISEALVSLGYLIGINIPKRYRRHLDELKEQ